MEKKILCVGLSCFDVVMVCSNFPEEDSDQRCMSHRWQRGGNACNNCTIFAEFDIPCEYFGTLSMDLYGQFIKDDFLAKGICIDNCVYYKEYKSPTSIVLINSQTGSRTIVHSNENLPELTFEDFEKLDLRKYKWIHFEGRCNVGEIKKMIQHVNCWNLGNMHDCIRISIELEKAEPQYKKLLDFGDIIFISKDFAKMCGYSSKLLAVEGLDRELKAGSILICAWGEDGACGRAQDGSIVNSPAFPPDIVADTLGAGDTFISSVIIGFSRNYDLKDALELGCKVAGTKCGMHGISGLKKNCFSL